MKKSITKLMLLAAVFLLPNAARAQSTAATLPYSTGFETTDDNSEWQIINGSQTNKWFIGTAAFNGGSQGLYISDNASGTTNNYSGSATTVFAVRTINFSTAGQYAITFDWRCAGESTFDYLRCFLVPASTTFTAGTLPTSVTATGTPSGWIDLGGKMNVAGSTWNNTMEIVNITTAGDMKLVFLWHNDGSVYNQMPAAVDNVQVGELSCPVPTNVTYFVDGTITWSPGGTESEWEWRLGNGEWTSVSDTSVTLTDLVANTNYAFSVRAICGAGDTSFTVSTSFRTPCDALTQLPYVQNFDNEETGSSTSSVFPPCMMRLNNGTSNFGYPYVGGSTYNHTPGGAKGLYWYNTTTVGTYGDYQYVVLPGVDTDVFPVNTLQLNFWAKPSSTSYSPVFEVGVMTNPNDITTFQLMATVNVMNVTDWQEFEIPLASYTGTGSFVAIRALRPTTSWYAYVDDIVLDLLPSCPRPTDLTVDSVTTDEAYLSWVDNTSENYQEYVVEYRANGTTGPWLTATANDTTVVLTNLDINTVYELKLYAVCGMDDTSNVVTGTFRTLAGLPISEFPYSCGFEIDSVNGINEAADWVLENGNQANYWVIGNATDNGGSRSLYITNGGSAYSYTISSLTYVFAYATFSLSEGTYAFSYDWKAYGESSYDFIRAAMVPASVDISAGSYCGFDNASAMPAGGIALDGGYRLNLQNSWQTLSGEFVISTPGIYNMVFMWRNDASGGTQPPAAIDNVQLALYTCPKPQNLVSTSVSNEEITISWQPGGEETSWLVTIDGQSEEVYDTIHTFMQLSANTQYNIQVRAICGSDDTSMAIFTNVRTSCGALTTMPYVQDFEDAATGSSTSATFVNCMTRVNNGTQYFGYPYVGGSTYNHTPGGAKGLYWGNSTTTGTYGDYQYVVLPPVDSTLFPINTLQLSFWARPSSTSYSPQFQVGVMTNPNDPNSFTQVATINVLATTTWQEFTTLFGSYTGAGNFVAIRALRPTSSWYAYVDDITLEPIPNCAPVVSHNVLATAAAARITWNYDINFPTSPDSYEVSYGYAADSLVNATVINTSDLAVTITGLTPDTSYMVSISPVCDGNPDLGHTFQFSTSALPCAEWDTTGVGGNSSPEASYVVGTPGTSTTNVMPVNGGYNYSYCNHLIKRSDIPTVPSGTTYFSGIDFQFAGAQPMTSKTNCTIYMCHTTMTTCDAFANPADLVLVYEGPLNCTTTGWNHFEFNRGTFAYNGTSNIIVAIVDNSGAHNSGDNFYYESMSGSHSHRVYRDDAPYTFADLGTVTAGTSVWRSNMHLTTGGNGGGTCIMQANCAAPAVSVEQDSNGNFELSWIPGYLETSWDVDYSPAGSNTWTTVATGTTLMSYTILQSDLLPNTEYTFRVAANCTDSNIAGTVNFTTPCAPYPVPFNESFDTWSSTVADPLPNCWLKHTNYSSNYPYASTSQHHSGTKSMYMYSTATTYSYMVLPQFALPIDSTVVSFWLYASSTAYSLQVGVMTDPDDVTTFQQVAQVTPTAVSTWEPFEIPFASYHGTGRYIAIMSPDGIASYPYLDDLSVTRLSSCPRVTSVTSENVTQNSATIKWGLTSATDYEVQYGPDGFALGTGTTVQVSNVDSLDIIGLAPNTAYDVYVRGICTDDTGAWSYSHNFRTTCGLISVLPFVENFEGYATSSSTSRDFIPCWFRLNNGTSYYGYPYLSNSTTYNHTVGGSAGLYWYNTTTTGTYGDYQYIILPEVDTTLFPINTLQLTFWARSSSTSYYPVFEVGVMSSNTDTTFESIATINVGNNTEWTEFTTGFGAHVGAGSFVAIRALRPTSSWYAYVDDVTLELLPACARVLNPHATTALTTSATIVWTDTSSTTAWYVEYDTMEFIPGTNHMTPIYVQDTFCVLTGLDSGTVYHVYVYPDCLGDVFARYTRFTTLAAAPTTVPYFCDFEGAGVNGWDLINGTQTNHWTVGTATNNGGTRSLYVTNNGTSNDYSTSNISYSYAVRVFNFVDAGEYAYSFDWKCNGEGSYDFVRVLVAPSGENVEAGTPLFGSSAYNFGQTVAPAPWIDLSGRTATPYGLNLQTTWQTRSGSFAITTPGTYKLVIAWVNDGSSGTTPPGAIDNVSLILNTCPAPIDLVAVSSSTNSITFDWTDLTTPNSYEVEYTNGLTTQTTTANSHPVTLTGLAGSTTYSIRVRPICGPADTGMWSESLSVATDCGLAALPYYENFNTINGTTYSTAGELPACWVGYSNGTTTSYEPHVVGSGSYHYSPDNSNSLCMTSGSSTYGDTKMVRLPVFSAPVSGLTLSFWMATESSSSGTLSIGYLTGPDFSSFVEVESIPASTITYNSNGGIYDTVSFASAPSTAQYIAFKWVYNTSFYSVSIDEVMVTGTGSIACDDPIILSNTTTETTATLTWGSTGASSYEVAVVEGTWVAPASGTVVADTTYTFNGLVGETVYTLGVRSVCSANVRSEWATVQIVTASHPCDIPTNVIARDITFNGATIAWTNGDEETEWDIHVVGTNYDETVTVQTNPYTLTGLNAAQEYTVTVRARCDETNFSEWSAPATFSTQTCQPVNGVSVGNITANGATVSWTAPAGVSDFEVEYGTSGFARGNGTTVAVSGTSYAITGLSANMAYDVYVRSVCAEGVNSAWSEAVEFTTLENQGIDDVANAAISLYPNPASSTVTISGISGEATVTVVDMNGRVVITTQTLSDSVTLSLSDLAQGAYFVRITGEQVNAIRKLIVK